MTQTCQTWTRKSFPVRGETQKNQRQNRKLGLFIVCPQKKLIKQSQKWTKKAENKKKQKEKEQRNQLKTTELFRSIFRRQLNNFEKLTCFRFKVFLL